MAWLGQLGMHAPSQRQANSQLPSTASAQTVGAVLPGSAHKQSCPSSKAAPEAVMSCHRQLYPSPQIHLLRLRPEPAHRTLGALAEKCHAYAKALHYRELEFRADPQGAVEALISINHKLRLPEADDSILVYAQGTLHMDLKVCQHTS